MAKTCKSCGALYSGSFCDKCGYGDPSIKSKSLEKLKKKAKKKPERLMTESEKKQLLSERLKERQQSGGKAAAKNVDPNGRRNFLIAIAVVTALVVLYALISGGVIFVKDKNEVIRDYFTALNENDFDKFTKSVAPEIEDIYEKERKDMGLSKEDYMRTFKQDLEAYYGKGLTISCSIGREEELDSKKFDEMMEGYKEAYDADPYIREAYVVYCEVTYSGSERTETVHYEVYAARGFWKWKLYNVELVPEMPAA